MHPRSVERRAAAVQRVLLAWWAAARRSYPWREPGRTLYELLIAELLLKRTTARAAARAYGPFLEKFPDVRALDAAGVDMLEASLTPIGLYRQRAGGMKDMAAYLLDHHGGEIPADIAALARVPHVGPYTARAVLSFGHGIPAAVVDSNVLRVIGRLFAGSLGRAPVMKRAQEVADRLLPLDAHREFNWALLDLGATVCRYDRPRCGECPVQELCDFASAARGRSARGKWS